MPIHKAVFILFLSILGGLTPFLSYAGIEINEVLFNPSGGDRGLEFVEIYNSGNSEEDLSGWQVYPDGIGYFLFPSGFKLGPKKFVTLHLQAFGTNSQSDFYFSEGITANMGNKSGSVAIFSGAPRGKSTIKSFMQWGRSGETWESDAAEAGLWTKGAYVDTANLIEGSSVGLIQDGVGVGASSWKIYSSLTPGVSNSAPIVLQNQSNSSLIPSSPGADNQVPSYPYSSWPIIKVFAGEDKVAAAGSITEFRGNAFGSHNEPLDNARFWWNFGDGASQEGKIVSHIFQSPGNYTVGLHVSSGSFSASDYLNVSVVQNKLAIKSVIVGESGSILLNNPAEEEIDIGEWLLEDSTSMIFVIPSKTKIGANSIIAFSNSITGLLKNQFTLPVFLRYPGGSLALKWNEPIISLEMESSISKGNGGKSFMDTKNNSILKQNIQPLKIDEIKSEGDLKKAAFAAGQLADKWLFLVSALGLGILAALSYIFVKKSAPVC